MQDYKNILIEISKNLKNRYGILTTVSGDTNVTINFWLLGFNRKPLVTIKTISKIDNMRLVDIIELKNIFNVSKRNEYFNKDEILNFIVKTLENLRAYIKSGNKKKIIEEHILPNNYDYYYDNIEIDILGYLDLNDHAIRNCYAEDLKLQDARTNIFNLKKFKRITLNTKDNLKIRL